MNYYRFPDTKLFKIGFFLYLYALQIVARSTMYTSTILGFQTSQMIMLALVGLGGMVFLVSNRKNLKQILTDRRMAAVLVFSAVILLPMLIKRDWQLMYFTILLHLLFAVFLSYFLTLQEVAGYYVVLTTVLSVITLVAQFVLKPVAEMGFLPAIPFKSHGGWYMYNFGLTFACNMNEHGDPTLRIFGIFREPGLYQIFLFVAIHLNNYIVQWKKKWKMWAVNAVLFTAMIVTFATGGVLALGLYIVFLFFDQGLYRDKRMRILAVCVVILGAGALGLAIAKNGTWATELIWMIRKVFEKSDSYTSRVDSIVMDVKIFFENPLFGAKMSDVMYSVPNNTATSPILFAALGIAGGCIHVLSWVALAWKKDRHWVMNLVLLVILFVPFNTQNVMHDMFFWMFPIMALVERGFSGQVILKKKV